MNAKKKPTQQQPIPKQQASNEMSETTTQPVVEEQVQQLAPVVNEEVEQAAVEKAEPAPVVQPVQQAPQVVAVKPVVKVAPAAASASSSTLADVPDHKLGIIKFLEEYCTQMAPRKAIPSSDGAYWQRQLFNNLTNFLNKDDEDFKKIFSGVLAVFHANSKGVFAATHAFRFLEQVNMTNADRLVFCSLMDMLTLLADPDARVKNLRNISFEKSLKGMNDRIRQNLMSYFTA